MTPNREDDVLSATFCSNACDSSLKIIHLERRKQSSSYSYGTRIEVKSTWLFMEGIVQQYIYYVDPRSLHVGKNRLTSSSLPLAAAGKREEATNSFLSLLVQAERKKKKALQVGPARAEKEEDEPATTAYVLPRRV